MNVQFYDSGERGWHFLIPLWICILICIRAAGLVELQSHCRSCSRGILLWCPVNWSLLLQSSVFKLKTKVCYVFPILYKHSENYGNVRLYFQFGINLLLCVHPTWKYKLIGFCLVLYICLKFFFSRPWILETSFHTFVLGTDTGRCTLGRMKRDKIRLSSLQVQWFSVETSNQGFLSLTSLCLTKSAS